uniref:Uncharacterized protein n=1 Tax=Anopheles funestus TaxID=62324 RepID=A0A4Y0BEM0_ANOFN
MKSAKRCRMSFCTGPTRCIKKPSPNHRTIAVAMRIAKKMRR